jgi:choline transport protein
MGRRVSIIDDHDHLAALGVKQELKRNFSPLYVLWLSQLAAQ